MKRVAIRPPRLLTIDEGGERHASWTELFYDLVFVVAVAALGHRLLTNITWGGWWAFVGLFLPLWWAWAGFTFYADRYDTDDLGQRVLAMLQIAAVAGMAVSISGDVSDSSVAFAWAYMAGRLVLIAMYARARRHVPETRELVSGYIMGMAIALVPWLISVFVPTPWRFLLWAIGLVIDVAMVYRMRKIQARVPLSVSHLPERFGLFTILVLGESIAAVVNGLSHHPWSTSRTIAGALGIVVATGMWWLYFDNAEGSVVRRDPGQKRAWRPTAWIYGHLPLAIGLTATGIGLDAVVEHDATHAVPADTRWLLVGAASLAIAAMALLHVSTQSDVGSHDRKATFRLGGIASLVLIGLLGGGLAPIGLLVVVTIAVAASVGVDVWLNHVESQQKLRT